MRTGWLALLFLCGCAGKRLVDGTERMQAIEVSVDGRGPVWPPAGEGCDALVRCCEAMAFYEGAIVLACQLAAAKGGTCAEMQASVTAIFDEASREELPEACVAP